VVFITTIIQPQVETEFNHWFVPASDTTPENQPMVNEVGKLIKDALFRMGKTQSWLAEQVGVSDNAVSKWIRTGQISRENIPNVARLLGLYPDELLPEATIFRTEEPRSTFNTEPGPDIHGKVPLISWVQAGAWSEVIDNLAPGDAEEWISCPVSHSPATFVLRVRGESMLNPYGRPSFHDGDLIFVDPERAAVHGSLIVVRLDDDREATFKRLVIEGEKRYLKALNPAWPEPMMEINGNATICGTVIFKGEKL
jgi:SOS-response transcriptional repressor LexA